MIIIVIIIITITFYNYKILIKERICLSVLVS